MLKSVLSFSLFSFILSISFWFLNFEKLLEHSVKSFPRIFLSGQELNSTSFIIRNSDLRRICIIFCIDLNYFFEFLSFLFMFSKVLFSFRFLLFSCDIVSQHSFSSVYKSVPVLSWFTIRLYSLRSKYDSL